jgi:CheY-like chemotaxis protein
VYVELARCLGLAASDTPMHWRRKTDTAQWSRFRGLDVLVVEDVEVNQEVMLELLAGVGIRARLAENGAEALTAVADKVPDVVLMDCQMPVMDGFAATRKLRENPAWSTLPVIALTANALADDRARCFAAGMNAHVAKPIRLEVLYESLLQWLPDYVPLPLSLPAIEAEADSADIESVLPEFAGIDVALGMAHVGRLPLLLRVLKRFRDNQGRHFAAQFSEAMVAADQEGMLRLAHSLKGVARTLGATELGEAAAQLETAITANATPQLSQQFERVAAQLKQLCAELHRVDSLLDAEAGQR